MYIFIYHSSWIILKKAYTNIGIKLIIINLDFMPLSLKWNCSGEIKLWNYDLRNEYKNNNSEDDMNHESVIKWFF